jgi:hypothetical protein
MPERIGIVMFSLDSGKETSTDDGTAHQVSDVSDLLRLLRAQEQLLDGAMTEKDLNSYEIRAQQISELLKRHNNG